VESNHRTELRRLPLCPLSYGAVPGQLSGAEPEKAVGRLGRDQSVAPSGGRFGASDEGVANGTRTRDHRDHNPGLYQLSYRHRGAETE
jgi:hypothetical protein